jgi:hypothetical protein
MNAPPRSASLTRVHAVVAGVTLLLGVQFLLLAVAVEAYLGGADALLWPAAIVSGLCCLGSCGLAYLLGKEAPAR